MDFYFKRICDKDCESKKIFENATKYHDFLLTTAVNCMCCIHHIERDNFLPREGVVEKQKSLTEKTISWFVNGCN